MVTASDMSLASFPVLQHSYLLAGLKCFARDVCYQHMRNTSGLSRHYLYCKLMTAVVEDCDKATNSLGVRLVITHSLVIRKRLWNGLE